MRISPRPYQWETIDKVRRAWDQGAQNVVLIAPTGAGKTVMLAQIVSEHSGASCLLAHRSELVSQISLTLARYGVRHNIIAADATRRAIAAAHVAEFGVCYYSPSARCAVASVDTLIRADGLDAWFRQVTLWISDEGHHLLRANKWGAAVAKFTHPQVKGLLPTATPERPDGKGLGRHADGLADAMVEAPPMRWLIDQGFLTPYRIICVKSDLQMLEERIGATGDWSLQQLKRASERSRIVGDVVSSYLRFTPGRLGITFTTDVETATKMTAAYRAAGVRAECLTGKTQDDYRRQILRRYAAREIDQIVAVDIVSEGFDLPAIEVASFARPSQSRVLVWQQFGRALRTLPGKTEAVIIDHVGNLLNPKIGLPDRPVIWSMDGAGKRPGASDGIPMRVCPGCAAPFERIYRECPFCGHYEEPAGRALPQQVDGELAEMSPELLARLRGDVDQALRTVDEERDRLAATGLHHAGVMGGVAHHANRLAALAQLRAGMKEWGGRRLAEGMTDGQMQRAFMLRFGIDVLSAQALKRAEAETLLDRIVKSA